MEDKTLKTGTTTVGIICKDAVVVAADQKSTIGYMVDSKVARKIYRLDNHIGMTIAGSVSDALALVRLLKAQFKLYRLERGPITMKAAANLLSNIMHGTKFLPYLNQLILAGFDKKPGLYSFDPLGGYDVKDKFYSTGSKKQKVDYLNIKQYEDGFLSLGYWKTGRESYLKAARRLLKLFMAERSIMGLILLFSESMGKRLRS